MEALYKQFEKQGDDEISNELLELLSAARKLKWEQQTQEIDFTHSSRKGWRLIRHLGRGFKAGQNEVKYGPESNCVRRRPELKENFTGKQLQM